MNADLLAVLTFTAGYNTAIATAGCAALGAAGGGVGVFLLLRARAMAADAAGHATLPGIVLAFLLAGWAGAEARSLPILLTGAAVTGALGMALIVAAGRTTRLGADAAIAITLSVSYALGIVLLSYVQTRPDTAQGGLHTFILGQAAALSAGEAIAVGMLAAVAVLILSLLFRPLTLLCFDADQARSEGWPVVPLDMLLVGLGLAVVLFGLQAVGLVLVVSLLILPAASARFWTGRLVVVFRLAVAFGAGGAWLGAGALGRLAPPSDGPIDRAGAGRIVRRKPASRPPSRRVGGVPAARRLRVAFAGPAGHGTGPALPGYGAVRLDEERHPDRAGPRGVGPARTVGPVPRGDARGGTRTRGVGDRAGAGRRGAHA